MTAAAVLVVLQGVVLILAGVVLALLVALAETLLDEGSHGTHLHPYLWLVAVPLPVLGVSTVVVGAKLLARRAWAQVVSAVVDGLLLLLLLGGLAVSSTRPPDVVALLVVGATVVLLVLPASRRWFARR